MSTAQQQKKFDILWTLNLFGTAVGAGILFLPITAGIAGMWPLLIMTLLVGPMTYLAHRGLTRFVLASAHPGSDITELAEEFFGRKIGLAITLLYFLSIYTFAVAQHKQYQDKTDSLSRPKISSEGEYLI